MVKLYECFVCETRESRQFFHRTDADKFAALMTHRGMHVLRGISWEPER